MNSIKFYNKSSNPKYWPFSNFYPASFIDDENILWPTTEHYFQAMKFLPESKIKYHDREISLRKYIRLQISPKKAAIEGRRKDFPLRKDWETKMRLQSGYDSYFVKDIMMLNALRYKFTQHEDLKQLLLDTGDAKIIENSPSDFYWGIGLDGTGRNQLGKLLMLLRDELKNNKGKINETISDITL